MRLVFKADGNGWGHSNARVFLKRQKNRVERKRAKKNPECMPAYGKYWGYLT